MDFSLSSAEIAGVLWSKEELEKCQEKAMDSGRGEDAAPKFRTGSSRSSGRDFGKFPTPHPGFGVEKSPILKFTPRAFHPAIC